MKPSQVASTLRRIASALEASKNPDRTLVSRDLKRILATVGGGKVDLLLLQSAHDALGADQVIISPVGSHDPADHRYLPNKTVVEAVGFDPSENAFKCRLLGPAQAVMEEIWYVGMDDVKRQWSVDQAMVDNTIAPKFEGLTPATTPSPGTAKAWGI